jgi:uncharacterized protein
MDLASLARFLRGHVALDWHGIHGAAHWTRVRYHGPRLAAQTGARPDVVMLFAFLHDAEAFPLRAARTHCFRA